MKRSPYKELSRCRLCGGSELQPILSLGNQALTGVFPKTPTESVSAGPLELVKCTEDRDGCGLLQLRHSFNPDEMYCGSYGYRSGINQTMTHHLQDVVRTVQQSVKFNPGDVVLDIGSNDATLLKAYPQSQISLLGIDPSAVNFRQYYPGHIALVTDFFSAAAYRSVMDTRQAKVVTSIAMFYDLESPLKFAKDIKSILADDGVWVFEQSYMPTMLACKAYDTICHEHLEYYGLRQIQWLTKRVGLKILDVELNHVNGGSFCVTVAHERAALSPATERVEQLLQQELATGLHTLQPYQDFKEKVFAHRDELQRRVADIRQQGKIIFGYGASTKGNVILQFCGFTENDIPAIAERNPEKYGRYTPGTLIPICSEDEARAQRPDYFLPLPWHFRNEFIERERVFLNHGGRFLFPLPEIEIVGR